MSGRKLLLWAWCLVICIAVVLALEMGARFTRPDDVTMKKPALSSVLVQDIPLHLQEDRDRAEYDVLQEEQLKRKMLGGPPTAHVSAKPENAGKNRYADRFTLDHTRVVLSSPECEEESEEDDEEYYYDEDEGADYINANFIAGPFGEKSYVAAQAPLPRTLCAFWQMVWEQDITEIVMLTNLVEGTKTKAERYWPLSVETPALWGEYEVSMVHEQKSTLHDEVMERAFDLSRISSQTVSDSGCVVGARRVTQYHYIGWPDHGVPEETGAVEALAMHLFKQRCDRATTTGHVSPLLVHCSAGIGRTGTFITIMNGLGSCLDAPPMSVNVGETVRKLRNERHGMVQGAAQYRMCYRVLHKLLRR